LVDGVFLSWRREKWGDSRRLIWVKRKGGGRDGRGKGGNVRKGEREKGK